MQNKEEVLDSVSQTTWQMLIQEPFYGHFFSSLLKKVTSQVETLGVAHHKNLIYLYINGDFWTETLNRDAYKYGVLKHEILHIVLKHIFRTKDFKDALIFNIAADLVVNQLIPSEQLPPTGIFLSTFPELFLKPDESLDTYYQILIDFLEKMNNDPLLSECQAGQNLRSLIEQNNINQQKHGLWKEIEELSSVEKELLSDALNQSILGTMKRIKSKDFGNLPQGLQQHLKEFENSLQAVVNWRHVLRLFGNSSSRTRIQNTIKKVSKRYGTIPGIKIKKKQKLLIAVDTSGSIDLLEVEDFFNEIYHIWKQGAEVHVVECDTDIHNNYLYKGKTPQVISGGGGTSFEAPIQYANKVLRPDAIIYFTDGYGAAPAIHANCPILWLLSQYGSDIDGINHFQGRKLKMTA